MDGQANGKEGREMIQVLLSLTRTLHVHGSVERMDVESKYSSTIQH
jgi:hypothetical protein